MDTNKQKKEVPLGKWLQCKEGNMPEDYYYEGYSEVAMRDEITPSVIVPAQGYTFIEGYSPRCFSANRVRSAGTKTWRWEPKITSPLFWLGLPQDNDYDYSHVEGCRSREEMLKVIDV